MWCGIYIFILIITSNCLHWIFIIHCICRKTRNSFVIVFEHFLFRNTRSLYERMCKISSTFDTINKFWSFIIPVLRKDAEQTLSRIAFNILLALERYGNKAGGGAKFAFNGKGFVAADYLRVKTLLRLFLIHPVRIENSWKRENAIPCYFLLEETHGARCARAACFQRLHGRIIVYTKEAEHHSASWTSTQAEMLRQHDMTGRNGILYRGFQTKC